MDVGVFEEGKLIHTVHGTSMSNSNKYIIVNINSNLPKLYFMTLKLWHLD